MTNDNYIYKKITITTKTCKKYDYSCCDYYMQDNILTVFRKTQFQDIDGRIYRKFESHFPWESVENIEAIIR